MTTLIDFNDALSSVSENKSLLLGNGFSRACRNDLFAYDALFEKAKDQLSSTLLNAFEALGTTDFEKVMRTLEQAEVLVKAYSSDNYDLSQRLSDDANSLRKILANVIASNHPERMSDVPDEQFASCRAFLHNFTKTYTLNYDLLLYWALMKEDLDELNLKSDDGFRQPDYGPMEYVVWEFSDLGRQNIFYLHGALHIFDAGSEIQKYTWTNTGIALVDQIVDALEASRYPIYVSEGSSESKLDRIMHSAYLIRGYRSLSEISGSLFAFGLSFQPTDEHVLRCIEESNVENVFVSIFGDPSSSANQQIITRAQSLTQGRLKSKRRNLRELKVLFYKAESAGVWG